MLLTEHPFTLPCGYVDGQGVLHRQGVMRLATALDEVEPQQDARVRMNAAYLSILLLGRVVTQLGNLKVVGPEIIERLFAEDFLYLQQLYVRINGGDSSLIETQCPRCGARFGLDLAQSQ